VPADRLHAVGAASGESFAVATGAIDQDAEGLFILDYTTGELHDAVRKYHGHAYCITAAFELIQKGTNPKNLPSSRLL